MEPLTKRLHISGLSPNIREEDLAARFASFGKVLTLDGLGKLDGLGQPRPYVFMTLETTKVQLVKCMNLLNGTTWKGARLRIGEAKPDFTERIRKKNEEATAIKRPVKRRRLAQGCDGFHAADMTPISLENVKKRAAWRTTPLGRLIRPMRMRPLRQLTLPLVPSTSSIKLNKAKSKVKPKRPAPLVFTRIVKIDPERWGSTYMKGLLLESNNNFILPERASRKQKQSLAQVAAEESSDTSELSIRGAQSTKSGISSNEPAPLPQSQPSAFSDETPQSQDHDFVAEASRSRALLESMFAKKGSDDGDESDWGGAESMSDFELNEGSKNGDGKEFQAGEKQRATINEDDDEIEFVPRLGLKKDRTEHEQEATNVTKDKGANSLHERSVQENKSAPSAVVQITRLKDMFQPREEDAGFSILANLDLDLELDDSIALPPPPAPVPVTGARQTSVSALKEASTSVTATTAVTTLDTSRAFFFLHSSLLSSGSSKMPQDVFSLLQAKLRSTGPESPSGKGKTLGKASMGGKGTAAAELVSANDEGMKFYRTEDEVAVKARWEARRLELTRDWKRRHREALKTARRRGGGRD